MADKKYTYQDLIQAFLEMKRMKNAHEDLMHFHSSRYRELSAFFDVEFHA